MAPETNPEHNAMNSGHSTKDAGGAPARRRSKRWILLGLLIVLPVLFAVAAYLARKPIAAFLVQNYLRSYGVASVVEFDRLARGGFSARVRLGPATPEFAAEIFDVTLDYTGSFAFPTIGTVRLVRPVLRASYDGQRLDLGSLQKLVDEALARPPGEPGPSVTIEDGRLFVSTPYGSLQFGVAAKIDSGSLASFDARLEPAVLRGPNGAADIAGGTATAKTVMSKVDASVALKVNAVSAKSNTPWEGRGIDISAELRGIDWAKGHDAIDFSLATGRLKIKSTAAVAAEFSAAQSDSDLALEALQGSYRNGQIDSSLAAATLRITSGAAAAPQVSAAQSDSKLALQNLQASYRDGQIRVTARTDLTTDLANLKADKGFAGKVSARLSFEGADLALSDNSWALGGAAQLGFEGTNARYKLKSGDVAVRTIEGKFQGSGKVGSAHADGRLEGSLTARANVPRRVALDLVGAVPAIGTDPPIPVALADSLRDATLRFPAVVITHDGADISVAIPRPASLSGADGVRLTLSPEGARPILHKLETTTDGAFGLEMNGGALPDLKLLVPIYRMRGETLTASTQFDAKLNLPSFKDIHLSGSGDVERRNGRLTFASARCADIDIGALLGRGAALVGEAKGTLCSEPMRPVLIADDSGWRIAGTWTGASAQFLQAMPQGHAVAMWPWSGRCSPIPSRSHDSCRSASAATWTWPARNGRASWDSRRTIGASRWLRCIMRCKRARGTRRSKRRIWLSIRECFSPPISLHCSRPLARASRDMRISTGS